MNSFEIFIFFVILLAKSNEAFKSNFTYHPMGYNPLLYTPGQDPIIHLDQYTFNDTIFQQNHAFVVEFYADWLDFLLFNFFELICSLFYCYYRIELLANISQTIASGVGLTTNGQMLNGNY